MTKTRKLAVTLVVAAFGAGSLAPAALPARKSGGQKVCAPGQHGNPHPGFKPGSCK